MPHALLVVLIVTVAAACNGTATVGDVLTERIDDTRLEIEVVEVHDPAELDPEDDHAEPPAELEPEDDYPSLSDARLIAVELHLRNVGDNVYDGAVRRGPATRVTSTDGTERPVHLIHAGYRLQGVSVTECEAFSALTLASGETHNGCLVFGLEPREDSGKLEMFHLMLEGEGARPLWWQLND